MVVVAVLGNLILSICDLRVNVYSKDLVLDENGTAVSAKDKW